MLKRVEILTKAEEAILEASERLPQSSEKHAAFKALRDYGLPTRRVEAWHYTDLRNKIKTLPPIAESVLQRLESVSQPVESKHQQHPAGLSTKGVVAGARISFSDGVAILPTNLPAGVISSRNVQASPLLGPADAIGTISALTGVAGIALAVEAGAIAAPIEISHTIADASTVSLRHHISVGEKASASFVEQHLGSNAVASLSVTVTQLEIADGADVVWMIFQEEGDAATHLAQLNVTLGAGAKLSILSLNAGGQLVRREINIAARGEGSVIAINGVNLIGGSSHVDVTTALLHEAPGVAAKELFRNVVTGEGRGVFQGQIRVAQIAQKTDAKMACNTLLLSDEAEFSAKPELEIFADDVACGHGATVTDIRDEHLFYLRARGIPLKLARSMLVQAFVEEVFDAIEDEAVKDAFNSRIEAWLVHHG